MKYLPFLIAACLAFAVGCNKPADESTESTETAPKDSPVAAQTSDSPEAVFSAFAAATEKDDWPTAIGMITDESKQMIVMGMVMQSSFMTMDDESKGKSLEELFKKYGLDDSLAESEEEPDLTKVITDLPGFVGELNAWIKANADDADEGFPKLTKITDVKIDGDTATALAETEMGPQPIEFQKENGQWKVNLATEPPPQSEPSIDEMGIDFDNTGDGKIGSMQVGEKSSGLNHAFAYRGKFFDEPCVILVLSAEEVSAEKRSELEQDLKEKDGDAMFFADGPNVTLTLSPDGELRSMFAWIDNTSTSSNFGPALDVEIDGDTIRGRAGMAADPSRENAPQFQAKFDTKINF